MKGIFFYKKKLSKYLNLSLDILNTVAGFNLQGDSFAGQGLHEDLHASSQPQDQMKGRLFLDVIIGQCPAVLELLASEDKPLLVRGDSLLVLKKVKIELR